MNAAQQVTFTPAAEGRISLTKEANCLRVRDIGRGVTTGTDDLYRTFAVQAWRDGEIATEAT